MKAIIFDNDGVLVDTEPVFFNATRDIFRKAGRELLLEEYITYSIKSSQGVWHLLEKPEETTAQLIKERDALYVERLKSKNLTFEGVEETVKHLSQLYRLCIVTTSQKFSFDEMHKDSLYLDCMEFIITVEDVTHSKPDPEPYEKALSRLGLPPGECAAVEDSYRGLMSAKSAGLKCIIVESNFSEYQNFEEADIIIDSFTDLPEAVKNF